ncbi:MAG: DUF2400 family protein [Bacteroidales bacterium]
MKTAQITHTIKHLAHEYNQEQFFTGDPIIFPKHFAKLYKGENGIFTQEHCCCKNVALQDVEIAGIIAAHLAWGRRDMILRDTQRAMDEMKWQPFKYVMAGNYRDDDTSLHRTVKWREFARICNNLREYFTDHTTLEPLTADQIRVKIFSQKSNSKMPNKKIHMFRRWMVRNDGIVDLGLWKTISPASLMIPLDVHVHRSALTLGITTRKGADFITATEITNFLKTVFPQDPCIGDFALFAYAATLKKEQESKNRPQ